MLTEKNPSIFDCKKKTHITRPGIILRTLELVERKDRIHLRQLSPVERNKICGAVISIRIIANELQELIHG